MIENATIPVNLTAMANMTVAGVNMTLQNLTGRAGLAMMEAQLANMTQQAQVLQAQLDEAEMLSAKVLRLSCSVFVFLMQVSIVYASEYCVCK